MEEERPAGIKEEEYFNKPGSFWKYFGMASGGVFGIGLGIALTFGATVYFNDGWPKPEVYKDIVRHFDARVYRFESEGYITRIKVGDYDENVDRFFGPIVEGEDTDGDGRIDTVHFEGNHDSEIEKLASIEGLNNLVVKIRQKDFR